MGRRALPKVDRTIDATGHFLLEEQLVPWQPEVWFGRVAPLELEVGSGKGLFLRTSGPKYPERNFLGIELAHRYAEYAGLKAAALKLPNVKAVSGDAVKVLATVVPDGALDAVHVYFPDPWWKARHKKRRVLNDVFAQAIGRVLKPGGRLHFWTDVREYFESTLELLREKAPLLEGPFPVAEQEPADKDDYRTHRERRVRLRGEPVYRAEYVRRSEPIVAPPVPTDG